MSISMVVSISQDDSQVSVLRSRNRPVPQDMQVVVVSEHVLQFVSHASQLKVSSFRM